MIDLPEPHFVDRDPEQIRLEVRQRYEQLVQRPIQPAQIEALYCDLLAYRETLVRIALQEAAKQTLIAYARFPMIDHLGALLRAPRLAAQPARTTLKWTLPQARDVDSPIAQGYRVRTHDGRFDFETTVDLVIPQGEVEGEVQAVCRTLGPVANGYLPGQVSELTAPLGFEVTAANTTETSGGAAQEGTEAYRLRVPLETAGSSVAGPIEAYRRLARGAHPDIVDVAPLRPEPGTVRLIVLSRTGVADENLLALVEEACDDRDVRPLTDTVEAVSASAVSYSLEVEIVTYPMSAEALAATIASVEARLSEYASALRVRLGATPTESAVYARAQQSGVHSVTLASELPSVAEDEFADVTAITVTHVGFTEERPL